MTPYYIYRCLFKAHTKNIITFNKKNHDIIDSKTILCRGIFEMALILLNMCGLYPVSWDKLLNL